MKLLLGKLIRTVMAAALLATPAFAADDYVIDSGHTLVVFELNHLGFSKTIGWMGDVSGTISYDADDIAKSAVSVIMAVSAVNTNHPERDGWIKSDKALNVAANPEITFTSTGIEVSTETTGKITGDLTMNGVSKPVVLDAVFNGAGSNPLTKKETIGVSATTSIMRSDWGVTAFVGPLGDEIAIQIELEAVKAE
ncbi:MAG: YceI family protein [Tateyamaria sp.]|uniref:YceI family protein n=1 Tax=Tateyamaria sp. TaxID=1929288 RepID=UPI0032A0770F